ncbi:hypothetical protein ACMFMG_011739 [Clarireedia jacksonii]
MSSQRDSDVKRLEQLLEEANRRIEEADKRAEQDRRDRQEADKRAEQDRRDRQEADKRAEQDRRDRQEADKRAEQAESKTRSTTFEEYITTCHLLLSKRLRIQTDKSLSTQGSTTSNKNKPCPTELKPWKDFTEQKNQLLDKVLEHIPQDARLFSTTQYLTELGLNICDRPLASEKDLETYQRLAVERPTTDIISYLQGSKDARDTFDLGEGIIFENHANTLSDSNEEVQQSLHNLRISSTGQASNSNPKPRNADQICVYKQADGTRTPCMVVEYKPSHKLTVFNLRAGLLQADKGSMNIPAHVINRFQIPTDAEEKFVYYSEFLTAAALTQTYVYMVENGLEYGKVATGEADVFLWLKEDEPHTLYYHLAEPNNEVEAHSEVVISLYHTAVSQNLAFCLMALGSKPRSQIWRNRALESADKVIVDYEAILRRMPAEEKTMTPPSSVFKARIHAFQRSPIKLRPRKSRKVRNTCGSADIIVHEDPQSPSGSSDETSDVETPSKPRAHARQSGAGQVRPVKSSQAAEESDIHHRQYCTQACLLGLVRKHSLDDTCPNINAHRAHGAGNYHALGRRSLTKLMSRQLAENPDNGCKPLGKQGARGALFRLSLESYGYTFVAKGTVAAFIPNLKHEYSVYKHLDNVQGELVPVCLGNISLVRPYFLDLGVRIVHMLLMSWAGDQAQKNLLSDLGYNIVEETTRAVTKLQYHGVEHGDVRPPNVLWNPEGRKIILIDFERSEILKQIPILQEMSPNRKRKYLYSTSRALYSSPRQRSKLYTQVIN